MTKFSVLAIAIATSVVLCLVLRSRNQRQFAENQAALEQVDKKLAEARAEQERLSGQLDQPADRRKDELDKELANLRAQAGALREQARARSNAAPATETARPPGSSAPEQPRPPEYYEALHHMAGAKPRDAVRLNYALRMYVMEHQNQMPPSLAELEPYLAKEEEQVSGTNHFEIVYQGSLDALSKIPNSAVALLRDRETFRAPSGKTARVYAMADGSGLVVESDDDFKSWEAEHIVRSGAAKR
jgi:hypothetical protein